MIAQKKKASKLHLSLNTGTRLIVSKYLKGKWKRTLLSFQVSLKPLSGKQVWSMQSARGIQLSRLGTAMG